MDQKQKILTYKQAKELKWFCKNVTGLRQEYYEHMDRVAKFEEKLDRLNKTSELILKWCEENNINMLGEKPKGVENGKNNSCHRD